MNIRTFDLNLLRAFAALYAERSVSRAAAVVGLSQPAMSNALIRLRGACADPLFVRTRGGMEPTPLAQELASPVREALALLERTMDGRTAFDPMRVERTFRVLTSDLGQMVVLPALMEVLVREAPGIGIEAVQMPHDRYAEALESGIADLAIGHLSFLKGGFYQQRLFQDSYCCIASGRHPQLRGGIDMDAFVRARHIAVTSGNADAQVERELARRRQHRRVSLRVAHYHMAVEVVKATSLIATVPRRAVETENTVQVMDLPFVLPAAHVRQFWHRRVHQDAANLWLRERLSVLVQGRAPTLAPEAPVGPE